MKKQIPIALIFGLTLSFFMGSQVVMARPSVYENAPFGIALPLPAGLFTCSGKTDTNDHGISIFLGKPSRRGCAERHNHRVVTIFAMYNVTDDMKSLADFRRWTCREVLHGRCVDASNDLRIGHLDGTALRVDRPTGWTDMTVLAQNNSGTTPVNYIVTLTTDHAHLFNDLGTFRTMLRSIRLSRPD